MKLWALVKSLFGSSADSGAQPAAQPAAQPKRKSKQDGGIPVYDTTGNDTGLRIRARKAWDWLRDLPYQGNNTTRRKRGWR